MENREEYINKITEMTGQTIDAIKGIYLESSLTKHSEIRKLFMEKLNLTYGYANTLVHLVLESDGESLSKEKSIDEILDDIYVGKREHFRPMHEAIMSKLKELDFKIAPKKGYLSLVHNKQFAMIGPKTNTRMEIGLNLDHPDENDRLILQKPGSMCKYIVKLSYMEEVDDQLIAWLVKAYHNC